VARACSIIAGVTLSLLVPAVPALAQPTSDIQRCLQEKAPDLVISHCGRAFRSTQLSHSERTGGHLARGRAYFARGAYDRAIRDFDEAIKLSPGFTEVYSARGAAYVRKGEHDRAIQDLNEAVRQNPDFA